MGNTGNSLLFLSDANTEVSTDPFLQYGWFGPNMDVVAVSVPEPATIITLLGMGAIVARIRAKKNRRIIQPTKVILPSLLVC